MAAYVEAMKFVIHEDSSRTPRRMALYVMSGGGATGEPRYLRCLLPLKTTGRETRFRYRNRG